MQIQPTVSLFINFILKIERGKFSVKIEVLLSKVVANKQF